MAASVRVVDDILEHADEIRAHALASSFDAERGSYPGVRARVDRPMDGLLARVEGLCGRRVDRSTVRLSFSMVTRRGTEVAPAQRVPHYDATDIAGVVYLNRPEQCRGGTGFYRHRASGLSAMPRHADARVIEVMRRYGLWTLGQLRDWIMSPPAAGPSCFITESTAQWELTTLVPMQFNRLVLYSGWRFHSGYVEDGSFGDVAGSRRLTLNVFADWAPRRRR